MDLRQLYQCAEDNLSEMIDWLRKMVELNSFTTNRIGVESVANVTTECFAGMGFQAERVPAKNDRHGNHLFLRRGPTEKPPVLLVTHLDTVFPPEEEQANSFCWTPDGGGRIYGPGTVDNKGGTAQIWLMLKVLSEGLPDLFQKTHWLIAANSAEEVIGSDFASRTMERCPSGALAVLVFEGGPRDESGWHLVTARKGRAEFRATCHGRAAHAGSNHALGINAVVELARSIPAISDLTDLNQQLTVNIASVHGGTVLNRVPHEAAVELEMRAFAPEVLAKAEESLRQFGGPTIRNGVIDIKCLGRTQAWPGGPATEHLFRAWQSAAVQLGFSIIPEQRGGLSDANYLCALGPTLDGLGPVGGNAHCSERNADTGKLPEYVEVDSFVPKAVMNVLAIEELLRDE